jgi:hypothetical protein
MGQQVVEGQSNSSYIIRLIVVIIRVRQLYISRIGSRRRKLGVI